MRLAGRAVGEKASVGGIVGEESLAERLVHLIGSAADARADGGVMPLAACARALHRFDRRIGHAGERSAPPGMSRADHPAASSANRTGAQSAVRMPSSKPGRSVTMASAGGRSSCGQGALGDRPLRPNGPGERSPARRRAAPRAIGAPAVLGDRVAVVAAAVADVEPGQFAGRHAAAAPEEAVRQRRQAPRE